MSRDAYRAKRREQRRRREANETPEQRKARLAAKAACERERQKRKRANETPAEKAARRAYSRAAERRSRERETAEHRSERLTRKARRQRERKREIVDSESLLEKERRLKDKRDWQNGAGNTDSDLPFHVRDMDAEADERFDALVGLPDANGCRAWLGSTNAHGQPRFYRSGALIPARRYAFLRAGGALRVGRQMTTTCGTSLCVEPSHLLPVLANNKRKRRVA